MGEFGFDHLFNHTLFLRYFNEIISGSFGNGPVDKSRYYVLDITIYSLRDQYVYSQ